MGRGRGGIYIRIETLEKAIRRQQIWVLNIYELAALAAFSASHEFPGQAADPSPRPGKRSCGGESKGTGWRWQREGRRAAPAGLAAPGLAAVQEKPAKRRKDKRGAIKMTIIIQKIPLRSIGVIKS